MTAVGGAGVAVDDRGFRGERVCRVALGGGKVGGDVLGGSGVGGGGSSCGGIDCGGRDGGRGALGADMWPW